MPVFAKEMILRPQARSQALHHQVQHPAQKPKLILFAPTPKGIKKICQNNNLGQVAISSNLA
jgi:hypothetical protein